MRNSVTLRIIDHDHVETAKELTALPAILVLPQSRNVPLGPTHEQSFVLIRQESVRRRNALQDVLRFKSVWVEIDHVIERASG